MSRFKLLVTDLDGTLLDTSGSVHASDRRAIATLKKKGIHVSVCTGRMYSGTREIVKSLHIAGAVGCLDGSQVVDSRDDSDLSCHPIVEQASQAISDALSEYQPVTFLFSRDKVLHDGRGTPYLDFIGLWSRQAIELESVLDFPKIEASPIAALVSLGEHSQILGAAARLQELAGAHLQIGFFLISRDDFELDCGMVVRAIGANKATALAHIADHFGVSLEETVAVGDWVNDVAMLRAAGKSFAMAQAPDDVKEAAHEVLEADVWEGGGIAEAAERAGML